MLAIVHPTIIIDIPGIVNLCFCHIVTMQYTHTKCNIKSKQTKKE